MNPIYWLKMRLFQIRKGWLRLFAYPQKNIKDSLHADYDGYWKSRYDKHWEARRGVIPGALNDFQKDRAEFVLQTLSQNSPSNIVDVGCGDGGILAYLKGKTSLSHAVGVDVSEESLARARAFGIETIKADLRNPTEWRKIPQAEYLLLFEVLEHVPNSEELLRAVYDKAEKGVFFSFPNTGYFIYRLRLLFGSMPVQWRVHPGEHVRFWTARDLRWWLAALQYRGYTTRSYQGIRFLNRLAPSLFSAAFIVYIPKTYES